MHRVFQTSLIIALGTIAACGDPTATPSSPSPFGQARASKAPPPPAPADVGVTTTVYDVDAFGDSLLTRSDDYNGSGFATYSPGSGRGISGLTSHVTADGAWNLYIGNQTVRKLQLMLADAGLSFANGYYSSSVEVASRCFDQSGASLNIQLLAVNASYTNCSLIVDFDYNTPRATTYKLAMGPNFANTGRAMITCNAVTGLYCTSWTIEPNDTAANARVAILTAGNGTTSLDGRFYTNSYRVTASK